MRSVDISLNDINYKVKAGDIFQAKLESPIVHQVYITQSNQGDFVYMEILEKLSQSLGLVRVNVIKWFEDGVVKEENYEDIIVGPTNQKKDESLDNMTKKQLLEFAKQNNLNINTKLKKSELLDQIKTLL